MLLFFTGYMKKTSERREGEDVYITMDFSYRCYMNSRDILPDPTGKKNGERIERFR
jgi:hypothetical protein